MKILHIYDEHAQVLPGQGSVPTVIFYIAKHIAEKGHDITVLERRWNGLDYEEEIDGIRFERIDLIGSNVPYKDIPYNEIKKPSSLLCLILDRTHFALKANKYLKKNDFDVIHIHLPFTANILVTLNRELRKKMIYTAHIGQENLRFKSDSKDERPILIKLFSPDIYLMKRVRRIVTLYDELRLKLISTGISPESIAVVHNGINVGEFNPNANVSDIKNKYGLYDKFSVLFASTITPHKGVEYLVKAADILINEFGYEMKFLLAGNKTLDNHYVGNIDRFIDDRALRENVKMLGMLPYEELKKLYVACNVFVLPSLEQGGGSIALLEAMASGKPLIGTNVGGIPVQIKNGLDGFLVDPANENQLAEKIRYLIDNKEERIRMGRNSRKLAEDEFDWSVAAEKYLKIYEEIGDGI